MTDRSSEFRAVPSSPEESTNGWRVGDLMPVYGTPIISPWYEIEETEPPRKKPIALPIEFYRAWQRMFDRCGRGAD